VDNEKKSVNAKNIKHLPNEGRDFWGKLESQQLVVKERLDREKFQIGAFFAEFVFYPLLHRHL